MTEPTLHHEQTEALFDIDVPTRKGGREYLLILAGQYDHGTFWALAPIDRYVRENIPGAQTATTEFVWLIADRRPVWALIDIPGRTVLAWSPEPIDKNVREAMTPLSPEHATVPPTERR